MDSAGGRLMVQSLRFCAGTIKSRGDAMIDGFWHPNSEPDNEETAANRAMHWAGLIDKVMGESDDGDGAGFGFAAAVEDFAARVMKEDPNGPRAKYAVLFLSDDKALQDDSARIEDFDFLKLLFVSVAGPANLDCIADISSGQVATVDECDMGKDAPTACFVEAARFRTHEGPLKDFWSPSIGF